MPTYLPAPEAVTQLVNDTLFRFADHGPRLLDGRGIYRELIDEKVTIGVLMAYGDTDPDSGERTSDAITHNGCRALGLCSINNLKLRAQGLSDVLILFDGDWWKDADMLSRIALVDHELFHINLKRDKDGRPRRDDLGRPCIKMRPHSHEFGFHAHVAARHGRDSLEVQQARSMVEECGQIYWPDFIITELNDATGQGRFTAEQAEAAARMSSETKETIADRIMGAAIGAFAEMSEDTTVTISGGGKSVTVRGKKAAKDGDDEGDGE